MNELKNTDPDKGPEEREGESEKNNNNSSVNHIFPKISPIAAGIMGLVGVFILYQIAGSGLILIIFGLNYKTAPINSVRLITMASQLLFILLPALVLSKLVYEDVTTIIRAHLPKIEEILLFSLGIVLLFPLLNNLMAIQNYFLDFLAKNSTFIHSIKVSVDKLNEVVNETYGNLLSGNTLTDKIMIVLVACVVPPLCEETMFRGFIQRSFEFRLKPFWAAGITAVFFALYHVNPYGLIALFILGFYFGFAAYTTESIVVPMILHFLNNFVQVILIFIYGDQEIFNTGITKNFDLMSSLSTFFLLAIVFAALIYLIKKYYSKNKI